VNSLVLWIGCDETGQRVKRTTVAKVGGNNVTTTTYYIGAGQEVQNGVPVRYYSLGGNTLGVRQGASVSWLYGDHLGSTSASSGAATSSERYYAYGKDRGTGSLPTDHRPPLHRADLGCQRACLHERPVLRPGAGEFHLAGYGGAGAGAARGVQPVCVC